MYNSSCDIKWVKKSMSCRKKRILYKEKFLDTQAIEKSTTFTDKFELKIVVLNVISLN